MHQIYDDFRQPVSFSVPKFFAESFWPGVPRQISALSQRQIWPGKTAVGISSPFARFFSFVPPELCWNIPLRF
jgi:hypothetical protein